MKNLFVLIFLMISIPLFSQNYNLPVHGAVSMKAQYIGEIPPLRDLAPAPPTHPDKIKHQKKNRPKYYPKNFIGFDNTANEVDADRKYFEDPIRQRFLPKSGPVEPLFVVEGANELEANVGVPDVNGDVGRNHYVQVVNSTTIRIYDKEGNLVSAPFSANTIWSQIGLTSFSDPVIHYDDAAERWFLTDLAGFNRILYAVSDTDDPLGSWKAWSFMTPGFADYPKYGITPTAYVCTINEGNGVFPIYLFNRIQILQGEESIDVQRVEIPNLEGVFPTLTPLDQDGFSSFENDPVIRTFRMKDDDISPGVTEDGLEIWTTNIDWNNPASTSSSVFDLKTAPFNVDICGLGGPNNECITQPNGQNLDVIGTIIMNKIVYRQLGSAESVVLAFSTTAQTGVAGIRWMELRRTSEADDWSVYQEGTLAPQDGVSRWMPSISINNRGDIAMIYAVSSDEKHPSLRFTGRSSGDPLGMMTIPENEIATGAGSLNTNRFGDYFCMTADGYSGKFYMTGEYVDASNEWSTKVAAILIQKDSLDIGVNKIISPRNAANLNEHEKLTVEVKNFGLYPVSNFSVGYIFNNEPGVIEVAMQDTLRPDSVYRHTFDGNLDLSRFGDYPVIVFTSSSIDENMLNDTLRKKITHLTRFDAGITKAEYDLNICGDSITFPVSIKNFGVDTIHSVTAFWKVNQGAVESRLINKIILSNNSDFFNLSLNSLIAGKNSVQIWSSHAKFHDRRRFHQ